MSRKRIHESDKARTYAWRKNNKEEYNDYMKRFMRRWRAKKKSQSSKTE